MTIYSIIATETWHEHITAVDQVLTKLAEHGLTVRPSRKVEAGFEEIRVLGACGRKRCHETSQQESRCPRF